MAFPNKSNVFPLVFGSAFVVLLFVDIGCPKRQRCEAFGSETRQEFRSFSHAAESLDDFRYKKACFYQGKMLHCVAKKGSAAVSESTKTMKNPFQSLICLICGLFVYCNFVGCTRIVQNGTGVTLYQQGRYAEALHMFEQAKQANPTNPDTHYNLASTYHRLGTAAKDQKMLENAEAIYNQALELSPDHVECHRALAVLLVETGRPDKAFTLLKRWAQRSPNISDARVELAKLHQEFNQTKIAEQYLDEALAMDPNNARAWAERGRLRENSGELMQAVQNYQQSIALNSLQPELYQRIGALNVRLTQNIMATTGTSIAGAANSSANPALKSGVAPPASLNASAPPATNSASNTTIPPLPSRY